MRMYEAQGLGMECLPGTDPETVVDELLVFGIERTLQNPVAAIARIVE